LFALSVCDYVVLSLVTSISVLSYLIIIFISDVNQGQTLETETKPSELRSNWDQTLKTETRILASRLMDVVNAELWIGHGKKSELMPDERKSKRNVLVLETCISCRTWKQLIICFCCFCMSSRHLLIVRWP